MEYSELEKLMYEAMKSGVSKDDVQKAVSKMEAKLENEKAQDEEIEDARECLIDAMMDYLVLLGGDKLSEDSLDTLQETIAKELKRNEKTIQNVFDGKVPSKSSFWFDWLF